MYITKEVSPHLQTSLLMAIFVYSSKMYNM